MEELSKKEVSKRIIDRVLEGNILTREKLEDSIDPILSAWIRHNKMPKLPHTEQGYIDKMKRMQEEIDKTNHSLSFLKNLIIDSGIINRNELYQKLDSELKLFNYIK
jgi:hypothetical protein